MFVLRFIALCALPLLSMAVSSDELSFPMIAGYKPGGPGQQNTSGQFAITLKRSVPVTENGELPVVGQPLVCTTAVYDACYNFSNPLATQPFRVLENEVLTMTATYRWGNASFRTYQDLTPLSFQGKLCYSAVSATGRKWRSKNKPYPGITQNCPFSFPKIPFPTDLSKPVITNFNFQDEDMMPTSTFFVMIWTVCAESEEVCAFDTTENKNFIQAQVYDTTTTDMIIVSIVMSIFSVGLFVGFFTFDYFYFKKTGRGFYF